MRIYSSDIFTLPLPSTHRFPMDKYARLCRRVMEDGLVPPEHILTPRAADDRALNLAHDEDWVARVRDGHLTPREIRKIGFPWSPQLVERSRRSAGATIDAARAALGGDGVSVNLAGGTHHAYAGHGEGFCVFNDASVAARVMQREGRVRNVLVFDLDVHQGNGTASIHRGDPSVFTCSLHGARNYPFRKEASDLDVALPDGCTDAPYLDALDDALQRALDASRPDLMIYLAGVDPFHADRLGRLALTQAGLAERDRRVFAACRTAGLPVVVTMAGGYAPDIDAIVDLHTQTVALAAAHA